MREKGKVEILAPAGSYDIMKAVVQAGADAVYLGGSSFGARAYAGNFTDEELLAAIDYAHMNDCKIYMTVNTLVKEQELERRLISYLLPFYKAGLDAVIVQDYGVFKTIRECFPDMHIHASTQMTATGAESAALLKKMGASRLVTARELDLEEIRAIHESCDIEIESFIHGALCYCYSGQCLFSSFNGTRSGNRGRCAQPCRLAYKTDCNSEKTDEKYLLSPKDMCGLTILPDVIEAGVYSLKIEGRMKNVSYAAGVTSIYRKYADLYLSEGRKGYRVSDKDVNDLMDLYNRGSFTTGYYNNSKGKDMISLTRPNHCGTRALRVEKNEGGRITFTALEEIFPQDVFEIDSEHSFESGKHLKPKESFTVNLPRKYGLKCGQIISRMKNGELTRQIEEKYVNASKKRKVQMYFTAKAGENMQLTMLDTAAGICVTVQSDAAETAANQPAAQEMVKEQLARLGNTAFAAEHIEADMEQNLFIPSGVLKKLRRDGAELLQKQIVEAFRRDNARTDVSFDSREYVPDAGETRLHALAVTEKQIEIICGMEEVNAVYCDYNIFWNKGTRASKLEHIRKMCEKNNKLMAAACPHIQRQKHNKSMYDFFTDALSAGVDTFLVRSLETLHMLSGLAEKEEFKSGIKVIADTNLYTWNTASVLSLKEMCGKLTLLYAAYPYELTAAELVRGDVKRELVVYSKVPLMVSEQCVRKTTGLCDGQNGSISISGKNTQNTVKSMCGLCYTVMYDKKTYDISDEYEALLKIKPEVIRYEFTDEEMNPLEIIRERSVCAEVMQGHFKVGVE